MTLHFFTSAHGIKQISINLTKMLVVTLHSLQSQTQVAIVTIGNTRYQRNLD